MRLTNVNGIQMERLFYGKCPKFEIVEKLKWEVGVREQFCILNGTFFK